jgi:hypothetical protein
MGLEVIVIDDGSSMTPRSNWRESTTSASPSFATTHARGWREPVTLRSSEPAASGSPFSTTTISGRLATCPARHRRRAGLSYSGRIESTGADVIAACPRPRRLARQLLANNSIGGPTGVVVRGPAREIGRFDGVSRSPTGTSGFAPPVAQGAAASLVAYRNPSNMMVTDAAEIMAEFGLLREARRGCHGGRNALNRLVGPLDRRA